MVESPPPIIITAPALADPAANRAYAVETFDLVRLADAPSSQLDQILRQSPGVQLFRRSDSRSSHPTSQGLTFRALGGNASSRVQLVLDGVPQADPFGGWINWSALDPAALAEVRLIRGGGSVVHGPGALAGTIEMRSRIDPGVTASLDAGSRGSLEARARIGASLGAGSLAISARGARGSGFVPVTAETRGPADRPAPYRQGNVRALWTAPLVGEAEVELAAAAFSDRRERGLAFTSNRTHGADASLRLVGRGRWQWSALGYAQWRELESSFASINPGRTQANRVSLQDSVPGRATGAAFELRPPLGVGLELRLGGDALFASGESRELFSYVAGSPTRRRIAGGDTQTAGLFAEVATEHGRLALSGGTRIDHWQVSSGKLREWVIADRAVIRDEHYGGRFGWLPTARAGAVLDVGHGISLRSAAYLGWRMPTINELFRPFRAGADATAANPLLDPERLAGFEAGARLELGAVSASLTAFANRLSDAIANVTLGRGPGNFPGVGFVGAGGEYRQRRNLDAIDVRGLEASAKLARGPWRLRLGTSITDAQVKADNEALALDGLRPAQTPRFAHSASLGWERGRASALVELRRVGGQYEDDLNQRILPAATVIDALAGWPLTNGAQLVLRAENLLGERVVAGMASDGAIERATPRTLWLGLRFTRR
ncbi:MAG TPA: TonB-dependent receptor [Sphingomicrobium sp.]|nr:TonB-dependent receptor [Sphingomicrobium sp.]